MDVLRGIDISLVLGATCGAHPFTDSKRKGVEDMSTGKATFRRGIPLVNLHQVPPVPLRFVGQKGHKLIPPHVTDRFTQLVVLEHVLHLQALHTDRLVFTDQACRELMQEVTAAISDASVHTGDFLTSLRTILGALLLPGVSPLRLCQFLLICAEEGGVPNSFASREDHERLQAQVSTDRASGRWQVGNVLFNQDRDEVALCTVLGDGDTAWLCSSGQGARPHDRQRFIHLGKRERVFNPLEGIAGIGSRLLMALLLERGVRSSPFKEVQKRFVEMPQGLLQGNRRNLIEPGIVRLLLEVCQGFTQVLVIQALLLSIEGVRLLTQGPVIDEAATAEGAGKHALLLSSGVDTVLKCSLLFHVYMVAYQDVHIKHLPPAGGAACIPMTEARDLTPRVDNNMHIVFSPVVVHLVIQPRSLPLLSQGV
jgi:hypothetical protein